MEQLPLELSLNEYATLDNFSKERNEALLAQLILSLGQQGESFFYLWGARGVGRTHLLQACCHFMKQQDKPCVYLPLSEHARLPIDIFNNLESLALVCIDDIDQIANQGAWEEALFHFYNRAREHPLLFIITGPCPPTHLKSLLPDLRSRLAGGGLVYQLLDLPDQAKCNTLAKRAKMRGLNLPLPVAHFLLNRCSRNMADLIAILDQLDQVSLLQQRLLTIPFVKSVLNL